MMLQNSYKSQRQAVTQNQIKILVFNDPLSPRSSYTYTRDRIPILPPCLSPIIFLSFVECHNYNDHRSIRVTSHSLFNPIRFNPITPWSWGGVNQQPRESIRKVTKNKTKRRQKKWTRYREIKSSSLLSCLLLGIYSPVISWTLLTL